MSAAQAFRLFNLILLLGFFVLMLVSMSSPRHDAPIAPAIQAQDELNAKYNRERTDGEIAARFSGVGH